MQEVAAGRLDLDAPITRYLKDSKAPYASRLTSRMLMQHVSANRAEAEAAFGEIWQQAGITHDVMRAALYATCLVSGIAEIPPESRSLLPFEALSSVPTRAPAALPGGLWTVVDLNTGPVVTVAIPPRWWVHRESQRQLH